MRVKKSKKPIIIGIVAVLLIIILVITNKKDDTVDYSNMTDEEISVAVQNKVDQMTVNNLAGLGERDRMEYYVSNFINLLEKKEYEKAYGLLYEDFKAQYFPTAGQFQTYVESKFSSMMNLEFTNIERNGDVYVLWVNMQDAINGNKNEHEEYNFVVRENAINDVDISFSVKE